MTAQIRLVKSAPTSQGWAIGIIEQGTNFSVIRINPQNKYVTLSRFTDFDKARAAANIEWAEDKAAS